MRYSKFLVPVGAVFAAMIPAKTQATSVPPTDLIPSQSSEERNPSYSPGSGTVVKSIQYMLNTELHALILRQSQAGALYAGHGSHMSHASHASHASHRSGY